MSASQIIAHYESLSALTGQMREAAGHEQWDRLIELEKKRGRLIAAVKPLDASVELDEPARRRKDQLISEILAGDAEIRSLAQVWMGQLQLTMQSTFQQLRLLKEYRA
jgi:flagellar protein FliT